MKKHILVTAALLVIGAGLGAQVRETYDITTYAPPPGWTKETTDFAVSWVVTNSRSGGWCRLTIYESQPSSGEAAADFAGEWKALLGKKEGIPAAPAPEREERGGWTQLWGAGKYRYGGADAVAVLLTLTGFGAVVSVLVEMNSTEFMEQADAVLFSLQPAVPAGARQPAAPATAAQVSARPGNQGIATSTTTFDDGWVAQPFADYVRLARGQTTVFLHFGIEITDEMRAGSQLLPILWNQLVVPRYTVSNVREYASDRLTYFPIYFYEADAVDKATGRKHSIGFRVVTASGVARCIEIITPSRADFQRQFPDQERIEALLNYNKFAVTLADLAGTWDESSSSAINMYNSITGAYAGMSTTAADNSFVFGADGTYSSRHTGAFGMTSNLTYYDSTYKGRLTVSPWEVTLTNRFEGKTETFWAQYEAVRGGRILHLTNKLAGGIRYRLARTR
jgi:hypothetical protein